MATPLQFVVEVSEEGHLRARGLDSDISIEADRLSDLELSVVEAVFKRAGVRRSLRIVKEEPRATPPNKTPTRRGR
jgi:hypothetical protein